jgi:FkbM family methyltransferase
MIQEVEVEPFFRQGRGSNAPHNRYNGGVNRLLIKMRAMARRTGLKRLYYLLAPLGEDYEKKFHQAIAAELRLGDVVWDVGANHGFYTKLFGEKTGPSGQVVAFEPTPESHAELCRQTAALPWVRNEQMALGDFDGPSRMILSEYHLSNHLQREAAEEDAPHSVEVPVMRGDSYWKASGRTPNGIKIDVEGFEEEVLNGMGELLAAPELRAIFLEVHFQALEERGRAEAPARIEKLLRGKGMQTRWVEFSHLIATRVSA